MPTSDVYLPAEPEEFELLPEPLPELPVPPVTPPAPSANVKEGEERIAKSRIAKAAFIKTH
jgi:hypothetical protein